MILVIILNPMYAVLLCGRCMRRYSQDTVSLLLLDVPELSIIP